MHPATQGIHHVGLTVPDLAAARRFFVEQLGHRELGGMRDYPAVFVGDAAQSFVQGVERRLALHGEGQVMESDVPRPVEGNGL